MNQEYMKTRKILPLVLSMSLPMVISMAVIAKDGPYAHYHH